jgi:probable rRNA maturation factor
MTGAPKRTRRVDQSDRRPPGLDLLIEAGDWPPRAKLRRLASRAIGAVAASPSTSVPAEAEVSLVFTDDAHIRVLNRRFRRKDGATNVLSFPAARQPGRFGLFLGDIVLAQETISSEARNQGLILDDHLIHLIVHGFLHLLGFDHETDEDAGVMERLETAILVGIGVADPYAGGDGS